MRLFFAFLFVSLIACEKEVVTEKDHFFAYTIDDEVFIDRGPLYAYYIKTTGYLSIRKLNNFYGFELYADCIQSAGTYEFGHDPLMHMTYSGVKYGLNESGINWLEISELALYTDKPYVSGTFEIDLINNAGNEKLIRNGKFDLEITVEQ